MPRSFNEKCAICAWLDMPDVRQQSCYDTKKCRPKRSYYRNRDRRRLEKRERSRGNQESEENGTDQATDQFRESLFEQTFDCTEKVSFHTRNDVIPQPWVKDIHIADLNQCSIAGDNPPSAQYQVKRIMVEAPKADAALLVVYRETNSSPVCALEGRLFLIGELRAVIGPFSTLGYSQHQFEMLTKAILEQMQEYGFRQFTNLINRSPRECPIFAP